MDNWQNSPAKKSQSLCVLAHDLNNGLGVIAGYCELLAERPGIDEECLRRLQVIAETVRRLAQKIKGHECRLASAAPSTSEGGKSRKEATVA